MRLTKARTLTVIAVAGALAVAGCGEDEGDAGVAGNGIDRGFVGDMIPHHEAAIEMAKIAQQRGQSIFVRNLAESIATSQREEIATMRRDDEELADAGVKRGALGVPEHMMGMDHDPADLKTAKPFDDAFLTMMIPHHEGALEMAKVEIAKGEDPDLKALAQDIIAEQKREIAQMRDHLTESGAGGDAMNHDEPGAEHAG